MRRIAGLALAAIWLVTRTDCAQAQSEMRTEIPIRQVVQSNGAHRYTVLITVGGTQIETGVDSGSTGLRILPGVVPAAAEQASVHRTSYSYDNGVEFSGLVVEADVTIGTSGRIKLEQIEKVGCKPGIKTCQANQVNPEEFGIESGGLPNEGFKAILGVNMASDAAPNPLIALGVKRWIITLPRPGEASPGSLVLNPTDAEVAGYTPFHLDEAFADERGGLHDAIAGCLTNQATKKAFCGPTDLDTGAPGIQVVSSAPDAWQAQTPGVIAFLANGRPVTGASFTMGDGPGSRVSFRDEPRLRAPHLLLGTLPYYAFSVLYDPKAKIIGLKAR